MNHIINCGLPKTGTTSLWGALKILGYKTSHNDKRLRRRTYRNEYVLPTDDQAHTNCCEWCFPQWAEANPGTRFIITTRDIDGWLTSCEAHFKFHVNYERVHRIGVWGVSTFNESRFRQNWEMHKQLTELYFSKPEAPEHIFMDICGGEGWEKLCSFLGHEIPNCPFPVINAGCGSQL